MSSSPFTTPSSSKQSNNGGRKEDDYTDYSCSTSIERLARDVETLLRGWHVDKGNDRHISMTRNNNNQQSAPKTITTHSNNNNMSSAGSVTSQISSSTSVTTQTSGSSPHSTLLLRSDVLYWNVSMSTPSGQLVSFTVELQLALWDGPVLLSENEGNTTEGLPHSMRRSPHLRPMAPAAFENMSHLFGVGQHITLSPIHPQNLASSSNASTASSSSSLYDNMQVGGDLQFLVQSIISRHDDEITARWSLFQVLSGWLQTALNCAVANCQCCIPVFGIWGSYQPDSFHNHVAKRRRRRQRSNTTNSGAAANREDNLSVFPSWMNDILHVELPGLPRMTRKRYMEIQERQNKKFLSPILSAGVLPTVHTSGHFGCTVIPCAPHTPSRLTLWGNLLLKHCPNPNDTVVLWTARHVFAWWKQPMVKASAFQRLFRPDNYHYDSKNSPFTAWRRKPKQAADNAKKSSKRITIRASTKHYQQQIIDLTGEDEPQFVWGHDADSAMLVYVRKMEEYQDQCRTMAISIMDQAAAASAAEPRWGPVDDPVASVHATVTWNGSPQPQGSMDTSSNSRNNNNNQNNSNQPQHAPRQPLLSFPLRIRSKHTMSPADWRDLEESVERTILDPLSRAPSCQFQVQAWWDRETPVASLAATQQCILAALVRTSTLPDETLLKHLTDDAVLEQWDNASGNVVAASLATQAGVGPSTKALVDAMDWDSAAEDKMSPRDAEILVMHILQPDNGSTFPLPPMSPLPNGSPTAATPASRRRRASLLETTHHHESVSHNSSVPAGSAGKNGENLFIPLFKSAPLGRLVSILCIHSARVRSPCSMAMLWMAFCHEVRFRWENRMTLPHLNHVPGLDPSSLEMKERNKSLSTLATKAEQAAYWHGPPLSKGSCAMVEPDTEFPGDHHCLIGQKLQVINLCIDLVTAVETQRQQRQRDQQEKRRTLEEMAGNDNSRTNGISKRRTSIGENASNGGGSSDVKAPAEDENGHIVMSHGTDTFEDALSEDELMEPESAAAVVAAAKLRLDLNSQPSNPKARKGARCPVPGSSLVANGDQMYAPYLQRPYPLTDDVIAERHLMLSRHHDSSPDNQNSVNKRLEISYRLQKPKLLSDMAAFKAANPGSIFQDFINWYGNPGNPLDEYCDTRSSGSGATSVGDLLIGRTPSTDSAAVKMDRAAEAIQMLNETREFWSRTWEEATPIPASEQKLLFDASSTVEMALDFMENMHPAILVNQVLAVNLASSYFTLVHAAKEVGVLKIGGLVLRAFLRLREKTEKALELLSGDATRSTSAVCNISRRHEAASNFVSVGVISACDEACTSLSEAEVVTARATSLLNKFPEQYDLVETFLRNNGGEEVTLSGRQAQSQILDAISEQQMETQPKAKRGSGPSPSVLPALREYVLRNLDDSRPCQLSVRFADEAAMLHRITNGSNQSGGTTPVTTKNGGGMLLALSKSVMG
ncbi:Rab3 GTPase-activating protein catalytic subunit [Seminavis robusta]|uniref:Rab3 GTPase-activating protein catalytic subunit n=1 Tax=Seminavis robusta TaxID=568900 RepID=A0A9N8DBW2_9STRA|nr:Rab3 GTPase-activating protein catalytic subunit [Seminavis robusta]|eukprot:Sro82_g043670.1 Rab3 GTPase-activating protein catalytic subunit (1453) ;mRNA; r:3090-7756